jgi:uncharacterized protein YggE
LHRQEVLKLSASLRTVLASAAVGTLCALVVALGVVAASRPAILVTSSTASTGTPEAGVIAGGEGTVSKKPDQAVIYVGVESKQSTASSAQKDLAAKAAKLIARAKALGITDNDINTSGYSVNPNYTPNGGAIDGYRASESLLLKWHSVDTTGKALDALVQEGGATHISVSFGLANPKSAQAEARSLAIADARSKAQAMASAAGAKLGRVMRVSELSFSGYSSPRYAVGAAAPDVATQVPVGSLDVQVSVEVDYTIEA